MSFVGVDWTLETFQRSQSDRQTDLLQLFADREAHARPPAPCARSLARRSFEGRGCSRRGGTVERSGMVDETGPKGHGAPSHPVQTQTNSRRRSRHPARIPRAPVSRPKHHVCRRVCIVVIDTICLFQHGLDPPLDRILARALLGPLGGLEVEVGLEVFDLSPSLVWGWGWWVRDKA